MIRSLLLSLMLLLGLYQQPPQTVSPIRLPDGGSVSVSAQQDAETVPDWTPSIRGTVTLREEGGPVAGLTVTALRNAYDEEGVLRSTAVGTGVTDDDGKYLISLRSAGRYQVATGAWSRTGGVFLPQYYPGVPLQSEARMIDVSPGGDDGRIDFAVSRSRPVNIRGQLIDGIGRRIPHIDWVWLVWRPYSATTEPTSLTMMTSLGKWRFEDSATFEVNNVRPGSYYLCSYRFDDEQYRVETVIPIEVSDKDLNIDLVSMLGSDVGGRIRFEGPRLQLRPAGFRIVLRSLSEPGNLLAQNANIRPDGTFGFLPVPDGRFRLAVVGVPAPYFVKSVRSGQTDVLDDGLNLTGQPVASLEVVLSSDGGDIRGQVLDAENKPAANSNVVLVPERTGLLRPDLYKVAVSNQMGQFHISGVAPGGYRVYAWRTLELHAYFDPAFVKSVQGRGQFVEIEAGGSKSLTIVRIDN